jgi:multisubunit Na+/H+ antiporter MnhB subunit
VDPELLRALANLSIRRGTGFALLAVATIMVAFAFDPYRSMVSGAILVTGIALILFVRALGAPSHNYKDTEVWIMLDERPKLPKEQLQSMIGRLLAERYFWHAKILTYAAAALWAIALLIRLFSAL